jgi:RHS repeat-associated protein
VTFPASTGVTGTLSYDTANRLTGTSYSKGGSPIAAASSTLDPAGNRTSKTLSGSYLPTGAAGSEYYCLDALNRLTSVRTAAGCSGGTQTAGYAYDAVGNRTSLTTSAGTTSYSYDAADQLTSVTPPGQGATTYSYDANGNQTSKGAGASFSWNALGQVTSATQNGITTTNLYNGDGFRMSRTDSDDGSTTTWTWDTAGTGQQLDDGGTQYLYGALGLYAHVKSSQTYYYLTDGLGSVLAEVKSDGTNAVSYQYDVYGNLTNQRGSLYDERQFAGEQADPTGLTYLRARFYDPTIGRFLSRDPKDGWSYAYAGDNPATALDPSGLTTIDVGGTSVDLGDISQSLRVTEFMTLMAQLPTDPTALYRLEDLGLVKVIFAPSSASGASTGTSDPGPRYESCEPENGGGMGCSGGGGSLDPGYNGSVECHGGCVVSVDNVFYQCPGSCAFNTWDNGHGAFRGFVAYSSGCTTVAGSASPCTQPTQCTIITCANGITGQIPNGCLVASLVAAGAVVVGLVGLTAIAIVAPEMLPAIEGYSFLGVTASGAVLASFDIYYCSQ